ncbi:hypothetical protein D9M68_402850 [compost metagenome]
MASSLTWIAVPMASTVSVLVIDCTRVGASPPTVTVRGPQTTLAWRERRAFGAADSMGWGVQSVVTISPRNAPRRRRG